jgi:hypothetical protein
VDTSDIDSFLEFLEEDEKDQRKYPRKDVSIPIKFLKEHQNTKVEDTRFPESDDKIVNISRGGVGIQTLRKFFVNDFVYIESQSDQAKFELKLRNKRLCGRDGDYFIYGCQIISKS